MQVTNTPVTREATSGSLALKGKEARYIHLLSKASFFPIVFQKAGGEFPQITASAGPISQKRDCLQVVFPHG
jgi:hypothetical protein